MIYIFEYITEYYNIYLYTLLNENVKKLLSF